MVHIIGLRSQWKSSSNYQESVWWPKTAVKQIMSRSFFFNCDIGVRQCDNRSPLLSALYLNDLQEHLSKAYNGLQTSCNLIKNRAQD